MRFRFLIFAFVVCGVFLGCLASCTPSSTTSPSDGRIPVHSIGDLPRSDYSVGLSSMEVVTDDRAFGNLARQVVDQRLQVLKSHRFTDPQQEQLWYRSIARVCELIPDYGAAARYRALAGEQGPAVSLGRVAAAAEAQALAAGGTRGEAAFDERFARLFREQLRRAPFQAIREDLVTWRGAADIPDAGGIRAAGEAITDPKLRATNGVASDAVVAEIINWREAYRSLYWLRILGPIAGELLDENA